MNFKVQQVDDIVKEVGANIDDDEEKNEITVSGDSSSNSNGVGTESPEKSVSSSDIPKRKNNHDVSPTVNSNIVNKQVRVLNPESPESSDSKASNIKCDYCDVNFKYKQALWRHVQQFHFGKTDLFICKSCDFVFKRKENLQRHLVLKTCLKTLTFKCKNCKMMFNDEKKLKTHVEKNCTKKYFCTTCLKYFKKKKEFLSHGH